MGAFIDTLKLTGFWSVMEPEANLPERGVRATVTVFDNTGAGIGTTGMVEFIIPYKENKEKAFRYYDNDYNPLDLNSFYSFLEKKYNTIIKEVPKRYLEMRYGRDEQGRIPLGYRDENIAYVARDTDFITKLYTAAHEALSGYDHSRSHEEIQTLVEDLFSSVFPFEPALRKAIEIGKRNGWRD